VASTAPVELFTPEHDPSWRDGRGLSGTAIARPAVENVIDTRSRADFPWREARRREVAQKAQEKSEPILEIPKQPHEAPPEQGEISLPSVSEDPKSLVETPLSPVAEAPESEDLLSTTPTDLEEGRGGADRAKPPIDHPWRVTARRDAQLHLQKRGAAAAEHPEPPEEVPSKPNGSPQIHRVDPFLDEDFREPTDAELRAIVAENARRARAASFNDEAVRRSNPAPSWGGMVETDTGSADEANMQLYRTDAGVSAAGGTDNVPQVIWNPIGTRPTSELIPAPLRTEDRDPPFVRRFRNVIEAIIADGDDEDFEATPGKGFEPTDAPAGSPEKMAVLRLRAELGFPLWHENDRVDYAGLTGAIKPRNDE